VGDLVTVHVIFDETQMEWQSCSKFAIVLGFEEGDDDVRDRYVSIMMDGHVVEYDYLESELTKI